MSFLEGSAPALPKIFGTSGDAPSKFSPNEFGAQKKIRQIPCPLSRAPCPSLAKASSMFGRFWNTLKPSKGERQFTPQL
jgi:hypothetical protein